LLDEPTNHLDLEMRQALAVALQEYPGAVVLVSHDRHLLKVNSDKLILVAEGRASEFQGSVDDYPKWLAEHKRGEVTTKFSQQQTQEKPTNTASAKKEQKRLEAERRQQLQPITNRIKRAERVMEKASLQKAKIEEQLADSDLYNNDDKDTLKQLLADQAYAQKELDDAETLWMEASEDYELMERKLNTVE